MIDVSTFRRQKDELFRSPDSPLTPAQRSAFTGLSYYSENPAMRLDLALDANVSTEPVTMQTSTGQRRQYSRAGTVTFALGGRPAKLTVYRDEHGYFLPFRDASGEDDTYPAGRYLEPEPTADGRLLVDFNFAYNPYCAYNAQYSCPIPPRENWLAVRIEAGEKQFLH